MTDPIQQAYAPPTTATRMRFIPRYAFDCSVLAAAIAFGVVFVELMLASTDVHWLGGDARQWQSTALTFVIYWASLAIPAFILSIVIRLVTRHEWIDEYVPVIGAALAGAGLWGVLRALSPELITINLEAMFLLGLGAGSILALLFARFCTLPARLFALQATGILAASIALLHFSSIFFALDASRIEIAPALALGWFLAMSVLMAAAAIGFRAQQVPRRLTAAIVLFSFTLPTLFFAIPRLRPNHQSPDHPNLLFVTADTLRADECSNYGGPVSMPALETLAAEGLTLDRFYTTAPWTVPSLCSMFSGRFPVSLTPGLDAAAREAEETTLHRLYSYWRGDSGPTLVGGMRARGYRTMAVVANPALNAHEWLWQDFDSYQLVNAAANEAYGPFTQSPLFRNALDKLRPGTIQERPFDSTRRVAHYAKTLLKAHTNKPFFLWIHFMDPHSPYDPPPELRITDGPWSMFPPTPEESAAEPDWPYDMTDDEKAFARGEYRSEIEYVDRAVGEVLDALKNADAHDDTYVCFLSDHGEEFWEHDRWGHGQTLFEEQIRVPFIIAGPRIGTGRLQAPISAITFAPTIADLLGLTKNTGWHAQSVATRLRDPAKDAPTRPVFAQSTQFAMYQEEPLQMVLDGHLKYVRSLESSFRGLYDLASDQAEQTNLISERHEDAARLHEMLEIWSGSFPSTVRAALGDDDALEADPDVLETLKSIGYQSD